MGSAIFRSFPGLRLGNEARLGHQHSRGHLPLSGHTKSFVDVAVTVESGHDGRLLPFSVSVVKHSG